MATTVEDVIAKAQMVEIEPRTGVVLKEKVNGAEPKDTNGEMVKEAAEQPTNGKVQEEKDEAKKEDVVVDIEPKTGVSFPVKLDDGKQLNSVGLRKKSMLGIGVKIYGFGLYADNEKMKDLLKLKIGKAPEKPTKEMYEVVIESDVGMVVKMIIVFSGLTMSMVRKSFDECLGASIKKLNGGRKNEELSKKLIGEASHNIKLTSGSVIEVARLPGYILQTKIMDEVVSKVESELLCRAFLNLYLGDDPFDKEAKEKFGMSLLSLF